MYSNPLAKSLDTTPMHKLVQIILTGHVLLACILSAVGKVSFSPLEILISTLVIVGASIGSNYVLAKAYNVRSDMQSPLITGLILALVLTPGLDPLRLAALTLIAVIAQSSKYVLAVRGRHIFNPAAIGLVIGSVAGLSYASWWVASSPLVYATAFAAFIMLYKLRMLRYGALFIGISVAIITLQGVLNGAVPSAALVAAFISWPVLFFVAFMFTEPTTLPPRQWQKYTVTAIIGILFALPFSIGPFSSSPAVALVIGNAVAFVFGQRRAVELTLRSVRNVSPTIKELEFDTKQPLRFAPGQYLELLLPHAKTDFKGSRRSFSITSVPESSTVSLGIRFREPLSSFKHALLALNPGETIFAPSISGDFVLPKEKSEKLLFVASGIGITPFISHLRSIKNRDIIMLFFVRPEDATIYRDELKAVRTFTLTNGEKITPELIEKLVPDHEERRAYVSGAPMVVDEAKKALRNAKVRSIRTDYFSGY